MFQNAEESRIFNVEGELIKIKNTLVNTLIWSIAIVALPALILSMVSSRYSDNFPYISFSSYILILISLFFLKKINYKVKAWGILGFGFLIGTAGLIQEGILSDGFLYYIVLSALSSIIIGKRAGLAVLISSLVVSVTIALLVYQGIIQYRFDTQSYAHSFSVWITFILVTTLFTTLILIISTRVNNFLLKTVSTLYSQSLKLKQAKIDLEHEIELKEKAKHDLSESEQRFKNVFNSIRNAIVIFDQDYQIVHANASFFLLTGLRNGEKIDLSMLIENFEKVKSSLFDSSENEHLFHKNEFILKNLNGDPVPVEFTVIPFHNETNDLKLAVMDDVRDKKAVEKQILNAIIQTEEKERTRISRDLHDCLGPLLSAVKLYSTSLSTSDIDTKYQQLTGKITEMMEEAIKTVKEVSNNLSSHLLKQFGLYEAIRSFCDKIQSNYPISIEVEIPSELVLSGECQITVYRVLVELINNTIKYASAKTITIRAGLKNKKIVFVYKDDGIGFDFARVIKEKKGMGLFNINSRIKSLGGYVNLISTKNEGTTVMIVI